MGTNEFKQVDSVINRLDLDLEIKTQLVNGSSLGLGVKLLFPCVDTTC